MGVLNPILTLVTRFELESESSEVLWKNKSSTNFSPSQNKTSSFFLPSIFELILIAFNPIHLPHPSMVLANCDAHEAQKQYLPESQTKFDIYSVTYHK